MNGKILLAFWYHLVFAGISLIKAIPIISHSLAPFNLSLTKDLELPIFNSPTASNFGFLISSLAPISAVHFSALVK
jgi:hypothetical protein